MYTPLLPFDDPNEGKYRDDVLYSESDDILHLFEHAVPYAIKCEKTGDQNLILYMRPAMSEDEVMEILDKRMDALNEAAAKFKKEFEEKGIAEDE